MTRPYTGRCACNAVTFTIDADPLGARQCWCRHCQQLAAGHATTNAFFPAGALSISGTVKWNVHRADSGNDLHWCFCPECGTQISGYSSARDHIRVVRFGALDRPHGLRPNQVIWTDEAPEWAVIDPTLERHERQGPLKPLD